MEKIGEDIKSHIYGNNSKSKIDGRSLRKILPQLGKALDTRIELFPPNLKFYNSKKYILQDSDTFGFNSGLKDSLLNSEFPPSIDPSIFRRYGGSKALSSDWHKGQSWIKYIIATQNLTVVPYSDQQKVETSTNKNVINFPFFGLLTSWWGNTLDLSKIENDSNLVPKSDGRQFGKFEEVASHSGYFNFGLSGIGRLPRLSRSFFHMLFSRNKLDDFRKLKLNYLKIYLMSLPLFNQSELKYNLSFQLFWQSLLKSRGFSNENEFRYNILFKFLGEYVYFPIYSNILTHSSLGTITSLNLGGSQRSIFLHDQYNQLKTYNKFLFFNNAIRFNNKYAASKNLFDYFIFSPNSNLSGEIISNFFFEFFNYFFLRSKIFSSKTDNFLSYFNQNDQQFNKLEIKYLNQKLKFYNEFKVYNSSLTFIYPFLKNFFFRDEQDFFRLRFYVGSFRSKLHWYYYPVHYFLVAQYSLFDTFKTSIFNLMIVNFSNNLKYNSVLNYLRYQENSSYGLFINFFLFKYKSFSNLNDLDSNLRINIQSTSRFFDTFSNVYINHFFSFGASSFHVNLNHKFLNFNFFNSLFLFRNNEFLSNQKFLTMNFFF